MVDENGCDWTGEPCPQCKGCGETNEAKPCPACGGTGDEYGKVEEDGK